MNQLGMSDETSLEDARKYAEKVFSENGLDLDKDFPDFDKNYKIAQEKASGGKTLRKDMPVIDEKDVKHLQKELSNGNIDLNAPFKDKEDKEDPFPKGLDRNSEKAKEWLTGGMKVHDGKTKDDRVKAKINKTVVKELRPIQRQIYFDKSIDAIASFGIDGTKDFLENKTTFVTSSDNHIVDGHHRFLSGLLVNPDMKVHTLTVDLPISKFLPLALSFSDAVGNKRNG